MSERKLARVVKLDDVIVHPNADSLELAIVGGWQCCVKKDEFKKGDMAVYFEIDSMLPLDNPEFSFLETRGGVKEIDGIRYSRIKTIKLRKELSQGLVIPVPLEIKNPKEGDDVTKDLGVIKHEKPEEKVNIGGRPLGNSFFERFVKFVVGTSESAMKPWPGFIRKTDQERVQNCTKLFEKAVAEGEYFEISYKLDGSSWTGFFKDGKTGVCSRNFQLQTEDIVWSKSQQYRQWAGEFLLWNRRFFKTWKLRFPELKKGIKVEGNNFVSMFHEYDVAYKLREANLNVALQGEMIGPSIQQNFEGNKELDLYIFSVYLIDKNTYMLPPDAKVFVESLGMKYVPLLHPYTLLPGTVKEVLEMADGGPAFPTGKFREGLVFKSITTRDLSWKAISNRYLIKMDE